MSEKAPATLITHLQDQLIEAIGGLKGVVRRKALASDAWFVGDHLFSFVNRQARFVVRLPDPKSQDELLKVPGTEFWQIGSRPPMRGWLLLPESMHDDVDAIRPWVHKAYHAMAAEPPKSTSNKKKPNPPSKASKASKAKSKRR